MSRHLLYLVIDGGWRVLVGRPLQDSRLALITLQTQCSLVGAERRELFCKGLSGVRLPVAQSSGRSGVHVTTTVLSRPGKNANRLQTKKACFTRGCDGIPNNL